MSNVKKIVRPLSIETTLDEELALKMVDFLIEHAENIFHEDKLMIAQWADLNPEEEKLVANCQLRFDIEV